MHWPNPSTMGRMWHKVNFYAKYSKLEIRVFLLLDRLPYYDERYLYLPPTRHDLIQGLFYRGDLGEGQVGHVPYRTMLVIGSLGVMRTIHAFAKPPGTKLGDFANESCLSYGHSQKTETQKTLSRSWTRVSEIWTFIDRDGRGFGTPF